MAEEIKFQPLRQQPTDVSPTPDTLSATEVKKRKRVPDDQSAIFQPAKKSAGKKRRIDDDTDLDIENGVDKSYSSMDQQLLADYLAQKTRKFECDLSSIELEDRFISAKAIKDTTAWSKARTLNNLPAFLETFSSNPTKLWSASKKNGTPHTIIVTAAGLRAAEIARIIRKYHTKDVTVAKLFAKHIKLNDAVKFLQNNRTGIAVGTPARLNDLLEAGALGVDRLERIVLDCSHIDQKKRSMCDIREVFIPLSQWLNRKEFKERYEEDSSKLDLMFY